MEDTHADTKWNKNSNVTPADAAGYGLTPSTSESCSQELARRAFQAVQCEFLKSEHSVDGYGCRLRTTSVVGRSDLSKASGAPTPLNGEECQQLVVRSMAILAARKAFAPPAIGNAVTR